MSFGQAHPSPGSRAGVEPIHALTSRSQICLYSRLWSRLRETPGQTSARGKPGWLGRLSLRRVADAPRWPKPEPLSKKPARVSPVSEAKSMAGRLPEQNSKIAAEATVAADLLQPALQNLQQLHLVLQAPPPGRAAENPPAEPATQRQGADESSQARAELVLRMRRSGAPSCGLRPFAGPDAAATKSLQSCPTLCDPTDGSPPGSAVPGILQARTLEWLPLPSPMHESEKWKWSRSVVSDSSRSHGLQPTRLLRPWGFPGKSTGVGYHCPLREDELGCCPSRAEFSGMPIRRQDKWKNHLY